MSRRGSDLTPLFPELAAAVLDQVPDGTQLDAEVVIYQGGRLSFDALQQRMAAGARRSRAPSPALRRTLMVFDWLVDQGADPTAERGRVGAIGSNCWPPHGDRRSS